MDKSILIQIGEGVQFSEASFCQPLDAKRAGNGVKTEVRYGTGSYVVQSIAETDTWPTSDIQHPFSWSGK